jgi:hypothetical protein
MIIYAINGMLYLEMLRYSLSVDDFGVALPSGCVFPIPKNAAHGEKSGRAFTFLSMEVSRAV